jgi:hypothetical protein
MPRASYRATLYLSLLALAGCGGRGCAGNTNPAASALGEELGKALGGALDAKLKEIDSKKVTIHILNIGQDDLAPVQSKLKALLPTDNNSVGYGPRFSDLFQGTHYMYDFTAAPVDDVKGFARNLTFGAILAIDPEKRELLVDFGKDPSSETAWGDGEAMSELLDAREIEGRMAAIESQHKGSIDQLAKSCPRENIATLVIDGSRDAAPADLFEPAIKRAFGPSPSAMPPNAGWSWTNDRAEIILEVGPDLETAAKKIDFARVRHIDRARRIILVTYETPDKAPPATEAPKPER